MDSSLLLRNACSDKFFQAQEKLGPVDMLVNCAGMSLSGKFEDLEVSTFEVSSHLFFAHWAAHILHVEQGHRGRLHKGTDKMHSGLLDALEG